MRVSWLVMFNEPEVMDVIECFGVSVSSCMEPFSLCLYHWIDGTGYPTAEQVNVTSSNGSTVVFTVSCTICAAAGEEVCFEAKCLII